MVEPHYFLDDIVPLLNLGLVSTLALEEGNVIQNVVETLLYMRVEVLFQRVGCFLLGLEVYISKLSAIEHDLEDFASREHCALFAQETVLNVEIVFITIDVVVLKVL